MLREGWFQSAVSTQHQVGDSSHPLARLVGLVVVANSSFSYDGT